MVTDWTGSRDRDEVLRQCEELQVPFTTLHVDGRARQGESPEACAVRECQEELGITVSDGHEEVRRRAHWVLERSGGDGAVRDVCEAILKAKGVWEEATARYFSPAAL